MYVETLWRSVAGNTMLTFLVVLISAWLLWRLWSFTIRPLLYPKEVEYLPYSIPFVGHAVQLFKNNIKLYDRAFHYYRRTRIPYALQAAGQKIIVVTDPVHMAAIYGDNTNYAFDPFIDLVYRQVGGVSAHANTVLWRSTAEGFKSLHPNPKNLVLVHAGQELLHKQLLSPGPYNHLLNLGSAYIENSLRWENISQTSIVNANQATKVVSLHRWVRDVMVASQAVAFFGPYLLELEPNFTDIFDRWDINSWMITYQYPAFLAQAALAPRERIVDICRQYLDTERTRRSGGAAFINELEDEMRNAGLSSEDCARITMIIMWGINSNVQLTTFWMMSYILQDSTLRHELQRETDAAMQKSGASRTSRQLSNPDTLRKELLDNCPLLNACFNETLRLCSTESSVRETAKTVNIGGWTAPPGLKVFLPQRQLLVDRNVFGEDALDFKPQRWLAASGKGFLRHDHYRPWGGGITMCSGKVIAKYEVFEFIAWTLWRFEIGLIKADEEVLGVAGTRPPRLDVKKPSLGISKQVEGDDLMVKLSRTKV